jgi:hypothetical protein
MGKGIKKQAISKNSDLLEIYNKLKEEKCLVEELIIQDGEIAGFNPPSVNTCRLYSILNKSDVAITGSYLRMGVGDVAIDNYSSGGIMAKVDIDTGIITTFGKNKLGRSFILHPNSNKQIIGFVIPRWDEIKRTIEEAARVVPTVRYVAWDVAVNNRGDICIIEGNNYGDFIVQEAIDLQGKKMKYQKLLPEIKL